MNNNLGKINIQTPINHTKKGNKLKDKKENDEFIMFENMTLVPFDLKLIDVKKLDQNEVE